MSKLGKTISGGLKRLTGNGSSKKAPAGVSMLGAQLHTDPVLDMQQSIGNQATSQEIGQET